MLKGRLGLETARIPHRDRHGVLWLGRGTLGVRDGTVEFRQGSGGDLEEGVYDIPFQMISCILLEPGATVTHDALRLLARHGTGLLAVGEDGVRLYASMPFGPDLSARARRQVELWVDPTRRADTARRMYAWRFSEVFPDASLETLRGMEGARCRELYRQIAARYRIPWRGRDYDRAHPESTDAVNQAVNHAAVATVACAQVAVAAAGVLPQLGFIHEESGIALALDIADLYREEITLDAAFAAAKDHLAGVGPIERLARRHAGRRIRQRKAVSEMIDRIVELFDDGSGDA